MEIEVDSAGTSNYHPNTPPDHRSQQHAEAHGYDLSALRARQVRDEDFSQFDLILAMDHANLADLLAWARRIPARSDVPMAQLALMSEYDPVYPAQAVPDPYYGDADDFERVIHQLESSAVSWIRRWSA